MVLPFIEHYIRIDLRVSTIPIELHEVITKDDAILKIDAVCLFQIVDPKLLITNVKEAQPVAEELVKTGLTGTVRQNDLADIERAQAIILRKLRAAIDRQTSALGIKVNAIQIKGLEVLKVSNGQKTNTESSPSDLQLAEELVEDTAAEFNLTDLEAPAFANNSVNDYLFGHSSYSFGSELYEFEHEKAAKPNNGEA